MKKIVKWIVILVVILGVGFVVLNMVMPKPAVNENQELQNELQSSMMGVTSESEIVETEAGIIFTGKVVPVETYYYTKDQTLNFNQVYVKEGDIIEKDTVLFDYKVDRSIDSQIDVLEKDFLNMKQEFDDYYTRIENMKTELAAANKEDTVYVNYLQVELNNAEKKISEIKVNWASAEEKIDKLKKVKKDGSVKSDIGGLVYQVNESAAIDPSKRNASSYVVLYSTNKKVRISVSEYEYKLVSVGQEVKVTIESLGKDFTCKVISVDTMPNNLETDDTSYYNVEIEIPEEVPYGYSAIVTVPKQ